MKWSSIVIYVSIVFHIDDFAVVGKDDGEITEFEDHLRSKYEVTTNPDWDFLGINIEVLTGGSRVLVKPNMLQSLIETVMSNGPTIPIP